MNTNLQTPQSTATDATQGTMIGGALDRTINLFENLNPARLGELETLYTADAFFKDPFNEVIGIDKIRQIFAHMYVALNDPRFEVKTCLQQGNEAFLAWHFIFRFKDTRPEEWQCIRGSSHLRFDDAGRISHHRDYWDAAEELYEKIPLLGSVMRWIKKKVGG